MMARLMTHFLKGFWQVIRGGEVTQLRISDANTDLFMSSQRLLHLFF
jgi:hypothetical protein